MSGSYLLLATATALLHAAPAFPATDDDRMVIIGAHDAKRVATANGALDSRLQAAEDEVAVPPDQFGIAQLPRAVEDGHLTYEQVHDKTDKPLCQPHKSCAGHSRGGSVAHRPCTYKNHCPPAGQAGGANAMHV